MAWRLVNMLSTNHLGLVEHGAGRSAQALRETLSMFAEMTDAATERRVRGIRNVDSRPVIRRIRERSDVGKTPEASRRIKLPLVHGAQVRGEHGGPADELADLDSPADYRAAVQRMAKD